MDTTALSGTRHPFAKLKPGMRVVMEGDSAGDFNGFTLDGTLLDKHKGTETLTVLFDGYDQSNCRIPYARYDHTPEAHPLDQIHPMLAKDIAKRPGMSVEQVLSDPEWALEEKYDGERQILTFLPTQAGFEGIDWSEFSAHPPYMRATTRVVGKNSGRLSVNSHAIPQIAQLPVPTDGVTVLDVELMHADGFQRLRSIMGSLPEKAIALQQEHGEVFAILFDVLWFNGEDLRGMTFEERRDVLEEWFIDYVDVEGFPALLSPLARREEDKRYLLQKILENGGEGGMTKHMDGLYTDTSKSGARSNEVLKIKPFTEDDVIIYGFEMGKGEYNGHKFGAIRFAQIVKKEDLAEDMAANIIRCGSNLHGVLCDFLTESFVHMGVCSGITDEQEAAFRADPKSFYGRVMEVRFQHRWPDTGQMRHPNFVRLREDKTGSDCVYRRDA